MGPSGSGRGPGSAVFALSGLSSSFHHLTPPPNARKRPDRPSRQRAGVQFQPTDTEPPELKEKAGMQNVFTQSNLLGMMLGRKL